MLRHVIAPARAFAQIPNAILRHPRLSPDAKTLLNWQLSLPSDEKQCLSQTAGKAGIRKGPFQRAKVQLREEGYLHEWRLQVRGGRFRTVQLVSNVPLSAKEAVAVRDGLRPAPDGARIEVGASTDGCADAAAPPSAAEPTVGAPTGPAAGRQPRKNTEGNTTQPTTGPESHGEPAAPGGPSRPGEDAPAARAAAELFLRSLAHEEPRLAMPAATVHRLAPLAERWLGSGLPVDQARRTLVQGLAGVRSAVAVLSWRLAHTLPDVSPPLPRAPRAEPRVARMRECATAHTQPRLFTPPPGSDERWCRECRADRPPSATADALPGPVLPGASGFERFREARGPRRPDGRAVRRGHRAG